MFRRHARGLSICALAVLVGGCGQGMPGGQAPAASAGAATTAPGGSPQDLVGLWRVEAAGEATGTVLRIGDDVSLWRPCSQLWGQWAVSPDGAFLADVSAYSDSCDAPESAVPPKPVSPPPAPTTPTWLLDARAWRVDGTARILLDETGRTLARLLPGGTPIPGSHVAPEVAAPPSMDSQLAARFRSASRLPAALSPAKPADVLGTWYPPAQPTAPAPPVRLFVTFKADGSWSGSDGCNSLGGRWSLGPGGSLLTTSRASTLVLCVGQGVRPRLESARRLGFAGTVLVLVDVNGTDIGHLSRG